MSKVEFHFPTELSSGLISAVSSPFWPVYLPFVWFVSSGLKMPDSESANEQSRTRYSAPVQFKFGLMNWNQQIHSDRLISICALPLQTSKLVSASFWKSQKLNTWQRHSPELSISALTAYLLFRCDTLEFDLSNKSLDVHSFSTKLHEINFKFHSFQWNFEEIVEWHADA